MVAVPQNKFLNGHAQLYNGPGRHMLYSHSGDGGHTTPWIKPEEEIEQMRITVVCGGNLHASMSCSGPWTANGSFYNNFSHPGDWSRNCPAGGWAAFWNSRPNGVFVFDLARYDGHSRNFFGRVIGTINTTATVTGTARLVTGTGGLRITFSGGAGRHHVRVEGFR